ncbi:hypothetical protein [Acinetobacter rudis]|uniref:Lycopene cyclase domain-containing protein n=1 Tax=Acinetobacter rudis TaxID=632955 RepID=A0AAW8JCD5_9GAMM|nr:hypothetical protein [Acinetobacter rudis]MDQ8937273.1 hypothetical protein [Acinetobacter rudis]MDQ9019481.1 hypothetical protein [Acinetobacter rudis]
MIESIQALLLLFFLIFTLIYTKTLKPGNGKKLFWLWASSWWLLLLGRSISWGRDYFPLIPKPFFRFISIILIANIVIFLFSKSLRQEISTKTKTTKLPFWELFLIITSYIISDSIEHNRYLSNYLVFETQFKDYLEEIYEFPIIIGLFIISFRFMKVDK